MYCTTSAKRNEFDQTVVWVACVRPKLEYFTRTSAPPSKAGATQLATPLSQKHEVVSFHQNMYNTQEVK